MKFLLTIFLSTVAWYKITVIDPENRSLSYSRKLDRKQFQDLIQSKTFFGVCEGFDHPVFKSFKYAINYNDNNHFDETLYLFSDNGCDGRLSVLKTEGEYDLESREDMDGFPSQKIDFRFTKSYLKVTDYNTKKKLTEISKSKQSPDCLLDLSLRYYEEFSLINKSCFDLPETRYNSRQYNIIGLATDHSGDELYLLSGDSENGYYHGEHFGYRPKQLNLEYILL